MPKVPMASCHEKLRILPRNRDRNISFSAAVKPRKLPRPMTSMPLPRRRGFFTYPDLASLPRRRGFFTYSDQ
ncbi:hypothetical protein CEXT_61401 [Caerostris extrusa]|uniref:Uncharacterized protein n=1 Tax=Caerostris extrusa TaxID=172846 RepID=A0AAV4RQR0_CAEEX|nr:hypothetical protein CEXT_61401 [Caerostris extrusa]